MKKISVFLLLCLPVFGIAQRKIAAANILNQIYNGETVAYQNVQVIGDLDLTRLRNSQNKAVEDVKDDQGVRKVFYDKPRFVSVVTKPVTFVNCIFTGDFIAYSQPDADTMYEADFAETVQFDRCVFEKKATFRHSWFKKDVSFTNSRFAAGVSFRHSVFTDHSSFKGTVFTNETDFRHTDFYQEGVFDNSRFEDLADFRHTTFSRGADFRQASFLAEADFRHTEFQPNVTFKDASFKTGLDFSAAQLNGEPIAFDKVGGKLVHKIRELEHQEKEIEEFEK